MKQEMAAIPTLIQGFKVMVDTEKHLGVLVTSTGAKGIIDSNIEEKRKKASAISQALRRLIRDPTLM